MKKKSKPIGKESFFDKYSQWFAFSFIVIGLFQIFYLTDKYEIVKVAILTILSIVIVFFGVLLLVLRGSKDEDR